MQMVGSLVTWYRALAGLSQEQTAEGMGLEPGQLAAIEQGRQPLLPGQARELDHLLGTRGALAVVLAERPQRNAIPMWALTLVRNEERARSVHSYETMVVPGLLQTEEYARAVLSCAHPPVAPAEVERRVAARLGRQQILGRIPAPVLTFIIEETVLHRPIGGHACLRRQIAQLRDHADLPFLTLLVVPLDREIHAGLNGPMVLLETHGPQRLAYGEGQRGSFVVDAPDEVGALYEKYRVLRTQALDPQETKGLLDKLAGVDDI
jgi:transcriptional regulator with XRE-family HTH domain